MKEGTKLEFITEKCYKLWPKWINGFFVGKWLLFQQWKIQISDT